MLNPLQHFLDIFFRSMQLYYVQLSVIHWYFFSVTIVDSVADAPEISVQLFQAFCNT